MRSRGIPGTIAALLIGGGLLLTTACSSGTGGGGSGQAASGKGTQQAAPKTSAATVAVLPADGTQNVKPADGVKVSVNDGKLTQVSVTGQDGKAVAGAIGTDGTWTPSGTLAVGTKYQVKADAVDTAGITTSTTSSFSTLTPAKTEKVTDNISDKATYGVGMIISVNFDKAVTNKKAAEQAITVEASDGSTVRGHWFGPNRLDLRPENFWKPGTTVTVHRRVTNVELSSGVYGATDNDETFTVGRSKVSTVDAATHQMTVVKDGAAPQTIAITAGSNLNPSWNGTMVVFEKDRTVHMDSSTTNIKGAAYNVVEPHALKITDTGSYVHGNPAAGAVAGQQNISHGCVGLPDTEAGDESSPAGKFFNDSIIGDVVIVQHSVGQPVSPDNGLSGWSLPWSQW